MMQSQSTATMLSGIKHGRKWRATRRRIRWLFTFKGKMQSQTEIGFIHRNEFYAGEFFNQNIGYIYGGFRPIRDISFLLYAQYGIKLIK